MTASSGMGAASSRSLWEVVPLLAARTATGAVLWRDGTEGFSTEVGGHRLRVAAPDGKGSRPLKPSLSLLRHGEVIDEIAADDAGGEALRALVDAARLQCLERERVIDGLILELGSLGSASARP